jgi:hypothetical protein
MPLSAGAASARANERLNSYANVTLLAVFQLEGCYPDGHDPHVRNPRHRPHVHRLVSFLLYAARQVLLGSPARLIRPSLERLWDRYPRSYDCSAMIVAWVVCLGVVLLPAVSLFILKAVFR